MNSSSPQINVVRVSSASRSKVALLALGAFAFAGTAFSAGSGEHEISFNRDVRPILADKCFHCHGPDPGTRKEDLRLDTEAGLFGNRKDAPATVIKGKPEESELFKRIIATDEDEVMPPPESHKKMTAKEIEILKAWIAAGAPWQPHWSLVVPAKGELPAVSRKDWVKNPVDNFVLAQLERKGLAPAPEADPRVFFRRLHLDILGVPPDPADTDRFEKEYRAGGDQVVGRWVDALMQSPKWGEHRGRYWLDAARYGDTHGLHYDNYREMWPYRDWVIRAFNANQPFSQFVVEQIAGDLLPNPTQDQLIATGFQRCGITTNEGGTIAEENLATYAAERVQTMGWVFIGMTFNCAQCHDHKFDPFTARDYYSMAAFFRNTTQGAFDGNARDGRGPVLVLPSEEDKGRWEAIPKELGAAQEKMRQRRLNEKEDINVWMTALNKEKFEEQLLSRKEIFLAKLSGGTGEEAPKDEGVVFEGKGEWKEGGKFGTSLRLGEGLNLSFGNAADLGAGQAFSIGAWVSVDEDRQNSALVAKISEQDKLRGYEVFRQGNKLGIRLIQQWPEHALEVVTERAELKVGKWQHLAVCYDGSVKAGGVKIFVDGKRVPVRVNKDTLKAGGTIRSNASLMVGRRGKTEVLKAGSVQDLRIYRGNLRNGEVRALANFPDLLAAVTAEKRSDKQVAALTDYYLGALDDEYAIAETEIEGLEGERDRIRERSPLTLIQEEKKNSMAKANVLMRGQYNMLGDEVEAATPAVLNPLPEGAPKNRLGLAQWLVAKENPLVSRVTVNRFWQEVFGQGIVKTSDDFGIMGAAPSNQELLDWLAVDFTEHGWDVRRFFKQLFVSAAYRQSGAVSGDKLEKDRENALVSRGPRFRMDAEMVRDYALTVSGLLSGKLYGPGTRPYQPEGIWDMVGLPEANTRIYKQDKGEGLYRRTIYNFWKRMSHSPNMDLFNAPAREASCVRRERTNTPMQALVTLNDPQFFEAARKLAGAALKTAGSGDVKAVDYIVRRVLSREPSELERRVLLESSQDFLKHYEANPEDAKKLLAVGESPNEPGLANAQLAAWTMVCNQVLNLDETLNK